MPGRRRRLCSWGCLVFVWGLAGCAAPSVDRPTWLGVPKTEDDVFFYVDGRSEGHLNPEDAQSEAFEDALRLIESRLMGSGTATRGGRLPPEIFAEARVLDEGYYAEKRGALYAGWARVRFPRDTARQAHTRANVGRRINERWQQAKTQAGRGAYQDAAALIRELIKEYRDPLGAACTLAEAQSMLREIEQKQARAERRAVLTQLWNEADTLARQTQYQAAADRLRKLMAGIKPGDELPAPVDTIKLRLASLMGQQREYFEAFRWYSDLTNCATPAIAAQASSALAALPSGGAYRFWPMNDRWKGRKVAYAAFWRQDAGAAYFPELSTQMANYLQEARLPSADVGARAAASAIDTPLEDSVAAALMPVARELGAGILWVAFLDTNAARRCQPDAMAASYNVKLPAIDTSVQYVVFDVVSGSVLCRDQAQLRVCDWTEVRVARETVSLLAEKYLVPKCPAAP